MIITFFIFIFVIIRRRAWKIRTADDVCGAKRRVILFCADRSPFSRSSLENLINLIYFLFIFDIFNSFFFFLDRKVDVDLASDQLMIYFNKLYAPKTSPVPRPMDTSKRGKRDQRKTSRKWSIFPWRINFQTGKHNMFSFSHRFDKNQKFKSFLSRICFQFSNFLHLIFFKTKFNWKYIFKIKKLITPVT